MNKQRGLADAKNGKGQITTNRNILNIQFIQLVKKNKKQTHKVGVELIALQLLLNTVKHKTGNCKTDKERLMSSKLCFIFCY